MKKKIVFFIAATLCACSLEKKANERDDKSLPDTLESGVTLTIEEQICDQLSKYHLSCTPILPSPQDERLYEAHTDDGLYLFLVEVHSGKVLDFLNNDKIGGLIDLIEEDSVSGIEWSLVGSYKIQDTILSISTRETKRVLYWENANKIDTIYLMQREYDYSISSKKFVPFREDSMCLIGNF